MAANSQATKTPEPQSSADRDAKAGAKVVAIGLASPIHGYLERLEALHDEAAETAHLANLLGRTPWASSALGVAGIFTVIVALKTMPSAALALWLALMAIAISATALVYGRGVAAPFERDTLQTFARNLSAILIFTGAAWGSGVALALPNTVGDIAVILYAVGTSAAIAAIFRARDVGNCFVVPATATAAFGALTRGLDGAVTFGVLAGGAAIVVTAALSDRYALRRTGTQER